MWRSRVFGERGSIAGLLMPEKICCVRGTEGEYGGICCAGRIRGMVGVLLAQIILLNWSNICYIRKTTILSVMKSILHICRFCEVRWYHIDSFKV